MASLEISRKRVEELIFDPENPRLPKTKRSDSEKEIIEYMIQKENVLDLVGSISEQGYFPGEPLLIVPSKNQSGKFEVVEGNRRLAALKIITNPQIVTIKKNTIDEILRDSGNNTIEEVEVIVFEEREEILDYLGYRHITGVDQWDSLAKARYLTQLKNLHSDKFSNHIDLYKHLAKIIGSNSSYVRKLLNGFLLYQEIEENNFYDIPSLREDKFRFSLLTTAVSYSNIAEFLNLTEKEDTGGIEFDSQNLRELTFWLYSHDSNGSARVPESRDLTTLNAIVANSKALEVFRSGESLEQAEIFTDNPKKTLEKLLESAYRDLKSAQLILHTVNEIDQNNISQVSDIQAIAKEIKVMMMIKQEDQ